MSAPTTIYVDLAPGGAWEVQLPDSREHVLCATLDDAVLVGHRCAASQESCDLVVRDAYHRVIRCEHVTGGSVNN